MKNSLKITLLVGALLCAPAFTACEDDPEPVVDPPEEPAAGDDTDPTQSYRSWFDLPEEDRWMLRWMLGDDTTLRGPGEYEFQVPASGDEFTFWFPDCDIELLYADLMGLIYYDDNSKKLQNEVEYTIVDNNKVKIKIGANPLDCPRKMVFVFFNTRGARASYIFRQEESSALRPGETLFWKSPDCRFFASGRKESPVYTAYLPHSATEFRLECLNVTMLGSIEAEGNDGAELSIDGNVLTVKLGENISDDRRKYHLTVFVGNASTRFDIVQLNEGYKGTEGYREPIPVGEMFMNMPELMFAGANATWKGPAVFELSPYGGELDICILNYPCISSEYAIVNGTKGNLNTGWDDGYFIIGGWFHEILGTISKKTYEFWIHDLFESYFTKNHEELKISPNYTNEEKVIEVIFSYMSKFSWDDDKYVSLIFIQPPINRSTGLLPEVS